MWVMTSFGVLMPSVRPAGTIPAGDNRLIQVRARRKRELNILRAEYLPELGEIIEIPFSDYEFRAYCTHEQWAAALAKISMDIDYTKFKPTTESKYGDKQLHNLYNRIWSVFFNDISTQRHQDRYLLGPTGWAAKLRRGGNGGKGKNRKAGTSRWWEDAAGEQPATLRDVIDRDHGINEYQITQDDLDRIAPNAWDDELPAVSRRPNGTIDHSYCDHTATKAARRRCRDRNR